jgi:hypothetical protein
MKTIKKGKKSILGLTVAVLFLLVTIYPASADSGDKDMNSRAGNMMIKHMSAMSDEESMDMKEMHKVMGDMVILKAKLTGGKEVPENDSPARGAGLFALDRVNNTLLFWINYNGLEGTRTGAHIHGPAMAGQNAPVMISLPAGKPITGSAYVTDAQETALMSGLAYVNIHTDEYPNGEIRGQLKVKDMAKHMEMMKKMMEMMGNENGLPGIMTKDMMEKALDARKNMISMMMDQMMK